MVALDMRYGTGSTRTSNVLTQDYPSRSSAHPIEKVLSLLDTTI